LTATDWGHSINSLDAGLHWLFNWLTLQHGRCLQLEDAVLFASDWAQAVNCLTQWVNYAAEELFTHWDGENFASSLNLVAFFEGLVVTKNNNANGVGIKVLCDADYAARELEQLIRHNNSQHRNLSNTVSCRNDQLVILTGAIREVARSIVRYSAKNLITADRKKRDSLNTVHLVVEPC